MSETTVAAKLNPSEVIGQFVSVVNSFEFFVNIMLEQVIGQYSSILEDDKASNDTIDFIEEQSLRQRIYHLILFLGMTKSSEPDIKTAINDLKEFAKFYNKNIRDIRDFIAHNPTVSGDTSKVLSSRRHRKDRINSIEIKDIQTHTDEAHSKLKELVQISGLISKHYPTPVARDFFK